MANDDADDKYTAGIDVSNACRMFYVSRLQTAETLKERLMDRRRAVRAAAASSPTRCDDRPAGHDTAVLEAAVAQLHKELASLIDIDLRVMRQLLMLNDQVEELKWQRRQQRKALFSSTCVTPGGVDDTDCSDSERRWSRVGPNTPDSWTLLPPPQRPFRFDDEDEEATLKYPTPSALSLLRGAAASDDRFSENGSVDALSRLAPDTPEVFPATPQSTAGPRERPSLPQKPTGVGRTAGDGEERVMRCRESTATGRRGSTSDVDQKLPPSPTKKKEQDLHSTNTDSLPPDFCTYVEMLI